MDPSASIFLEGNEDFLQGCEPEVDAMQLHGLERYEARKRIVDLAKSQGWLDKVQSDRHMVPHGDRSKVAIEPYLTDQWFVDAAKLVEPANEAVETGKTRILPEQYAATYFRWLKNIEPLVHIAATLVGASDTGLVRRGREPVLRAFRRRGGRDVRRKATGPRSRCSRYLVFFRPLADQALWAGRMRRPNSKDIFQQMSL